MMPKVSVVIPVYKVEDYLDRCLDSIVRQTLRDIEIILVDDGSPDKSPDKCDFWANKDSRVKVIHKHNEGLGLTRNAGLAVATGEYVAFVDPDDFVELDMMETLYIECVSNSLDCIYSEFNVDDYPGFRVVLRPERLYEGKEEIEELRLDIVGAEPSYVSGVKYHCSSCKGLYSLKLIREHNLLFLSERQFISEDMLFNLDFLYHATRVKTVPLQFYHYCLNGESLSHTYRPDKWKKLMKMIDVLRERLVFRDNKEFKLRLSRTTIFYLMCSTSVEHKRKDVGVLDKIRSIKKLICDPKVREALQGYPIIQLPIKWKIYTIAVKMKMASVIYLLSK